MSAAHAFLASGVIFGVWATVFYRIGVREGIRRERQRRANQFFGRRPARREGLPR